MGARDYYEALVGRWSGSYTLTVTEPAQLALAPLATRAIVRASALASPLVFATTLAHDGAGFAHTTRISKLGVPTYTTDERILLDADDRGLTMDGFVRLVPFAREAYAARGSVAADASGATYEIPWLGVTVVQTTLRVPEGLRLTQETPFSRAEVLLARR